MDMDWKSRGRPPKSQLILVSHDFPFRRWHLFWVKSTIFRSDWRITPASTTQGLLFGFVRTLALSPPFFGWVRVFYPEYPVFFLLPNFCRGHRGEIPHQVLVIHVMDHGPWTPVQQHSGAAYLMLLRSTLARHVGDVERAGRKKWWGWVKIPGIPHYSTLWKHEHPFTSCFHGDGIFGMISDHLMIRTFG